MLGFPSFLEFMEYAYHKSFNVLVYWSCICAISGSVSIDWFSPHYESFSCLFPCLTYFHWMPDILNFTLLGAGYFCIFLSFILEHTYLETVWSFHCCVSVLLDGSKWYWSWILSNLSVLLVSCPLWYFHLDRCKLPSPVWHSRIFPSAT